MKATAGKGLCFYKNHKVRIKKESKSKVYCMINSKRYYLNRIPPVDTIVPVTLIRARKASKYTKKSRNSRRKRRSKRRPRSTFKSLRSSFSKKKSRKRLTKLKCRELLSNKIRLNTREWKKGKFKSRKQAIAVSYSQIKNKFPDCKRYFKQ